MRLETSATNSQPEQPSVRKEQSFEHAYNKFNFEQDIKNSSEKHEQKAENDSAISEAILSTILPTPVVDTPIVEDSTTINSNPPVASDDDLIEKEWVERAKKIVAETHGNPHQRDKSVNMLQVDYLKKRYGRKLGVVE